MADHLQVSRRAAVDLDDEVDYEEMPESRAVLAEREHGAAMIRLLEQQIAQLTRHNAQLTQQLAQLAQLHQQEVDDRRNGRENLGAHLQHHAGGQAGQQAGGHPLAALLQALAAAHALN